MVVEIEVSSILKEALGRGLVKIIPEKNFDISLKSHPLEQYFKEKGIVYYFEGNEVGKKEDYAIDLTQIKIVYPKNKN